MQIVRNSEELTRARGQLDGRVALVPTMGALHAGHMALIAEGKRRADRVAATIFVNPSQFGPNEDFSQYPRQEEQDAKLLEEHGCDLLWIPRTADMYPDDFATTVDVSGVSERWEGEVRPAHFMGVATIVTKLLLSVRPDVALFGEKDFQQLAVIRRMVKDLSIGVEIVGVPTVRDSDGLALSSRNAYLSADQRARAVALPRALENARDAIRRGRAVAEVIQQSKAALRDAGFSRVDYFALVDPETLRPVAEWDGSARLIAAAVIGTTRLIDNLAV